MYNDPGPVINLVNRKKNPLFFSLEKVFSILLPVMQQTFQIQSQFAPHYSSSVSNIMANLLAAKKYRASVYHVTGDIHYITLALPTKKTILTVHDTVFMENSRGIKRMILKWLYLKLPVRSCRYVTAISEATKKDIVQYTGCSPDKVIVIPDPSNPGFRHLPKIFNEANPVILQVGTWPNKNLERVAAALEGIPCRLHIIGELSEKQKAILRQHAIRFSNASGLSEQELIQEYADADMVVFASTFEGFGLPVIEAQATGRPLVTSNISPMKEVAGEEACLVDPYNIASIREGIIKVMADAQYRENLITKGLENVKRFSPEKIAGEYLRLYKEIIDN